MQTHTVKKKPPVSLTDDTVSSESGEKLSLKRKEGVLEHAQIILHHLCLGHLGNTHLFKQHK